MGLEVGIDLGAGAVKVVAGRKKGPVFELHRALSIPVRSEGDSEAAILSAVDELAGLGKLPGARFSLAGRDLIIRYVQVPPVPLWRLNLLMDLEVRGMAEKGGEALYHDYNLVGIAGDSDETVMLAVVKAQLLEARMEALTRSVGEPFCGMPASVALFDAYLHSGELHEGEYLFLVDLGENSTEVVLQKDGDILFARNLSVGGRLLTQSVADTFDVPYSQAAGIKHEYANVAPRGSVSYASGREEKVANALLGAVGQLSSMIQSCLGFARTHTGVRDLSLGRILLTGGGANLRGLDAYLGSAFDCPVDRFLPDSGLDLAPLPSEEAAEFEVDPGRYSVALGLALSGVNENAFQLNLVPEKVKKKRKFLQRTLYLWLTAAAALLFLAFHAYQLSGQATELKAKARKAQTASSKARRQRKSFDREQDVIKDLNRKMKLLAEETETALLFLRVQGLLQEAASDGIWVSEMRVLRELPRVEGARPRGRGNFQMETRVEVDGVVVPRSRSPSEALRELTTKVEAAAPDLDVTQSSEELDARQLRFNLVVKTKKKDKTSSEGEEGN